MVVVIVMVSFDVFWALKEILLRRAKGSFVSRDRILFGSVSANLGIIILSVNNMFSAKCLVPQTCVVLFTDCF